MLSWGIALAGALIATGAVSAQPSPEVQKRIAAAIAATESTNGTIDYTKFVNPFIGTGTLRPQTPFSSVFTLSSDSFFYGNVW